MSDDTAFVTPRATLDDLFISREDDGTVKPIEMKSPLLNRMVLVKPMVYGYMKEHHLEMEIPAVQWPIEAKLELVKNHVVDPDMSSVSVNDAETKMDPMTLNHLTTLVVMASVPIFRLRGGNGPGLAETVLKNILSGNAIVPPNTSSIESDTDIPDPETSIH